jgi:hypothetical protein
MTEVYPLIHYPVFSYYGFHERFIIVPTKVVSMKQLAGTFGIAHPPLEPPSTSAVGVQRTPIAASRVCRCETSIDYLDPNLDLP